VGDLLVALPKSGRSNLLLELGILGALLNELALGLLSLLLVLEGALLCPLQLYLVLEGRALERIVRRLVHHERQSARLVNLHFRITHRCRPQIQTCISSYRSP